MGVVVVTISAVEPVLLLILKWGGELTPAGEVHAEDLGTWH